MTDALDDLTADHAAGEQYRSALRSRLAAGDATATSAFEAWRAFVTTRHGDVFAALAGADDVESASTDAVARDLFVQTRAFDFLLSRLLDAAERTFDVSLPRGVAEGGAIPLDEAVDAVHDAVASDLTPSARAGLDEKATRFVSEADPVAVAALHRRTVPRLARRAFGRYDTPPGLAELAADVALTPGGDDAVVLDPGCGAGAFLAAAAARKREAAERVGSTAGPAAVARRIAASVRGFDVNPAAVRASRLAVVLALRPLLRAADGTSLDLRVVLGDVLEADATTPPLGGDRVDVVLGNPPWLTWDSLTERLKDRWRTGPIADPALDLFDRAGTEARLGHANDDLSVPYAWTCLHRFLRDGGRAAFVLKRDLTSGPAGELLRRRRVGDRSVSMRHVHDFGTLAPFGAEVDAGTALYSLAVGEGVVREATGGATGRTDGGDAVARPKPDHGEADGAAPLDSPGDRPDGPLAVPATRWSRVEDGPAPSFDSLTAMERTLAREQTSLVPADPEDETGPWVGADAERRALGPSDYRIRHGVKDDAKAVYALDRETVAAGEVEPDHVYPYLKSKHVVKYGLFGHDLQLVPQRRAGESNEAALRRETPATYAYLDQHRDRLEARGSSWFDEGPFYGLFGLGPYTWADYKVVWCRLGFKPHFAVVSTVEDPVLGEKPVIPGDHCMFVATDDSEEAHYLCGLLNSAPYQRCLRDVSSGGKSSLSKSTVSRLATPEWEATTLQSRLAEASRRAHEVVPRHVDCSKRAYNAKSIPGLEAIQAEVDRAAERFLRTGAAASDGE
jgi:SAM-dependent methyltransferase